MTGKGAARSVHYDILRPSIVRCNVQRRFYRVLVSTNHHVRMWKVASGEDRICRKHADRSVGGGGAFFGGPKGASPARIVHKEFERGWAKLQRSVEFEFARLKTALRAQGVAKRGVTRRFERVQLYGSPGCSLGLGLIFTRVLSIHRHNCICIRQ